MCMCSPAGPWEFFSHGPRPWSSIGPFEDHKTFYEQEVLGLELGIGSPFFEGGIETFSCALSSSDHRSHNRAVGRAPERGCGLPSPGRRESREAARSERGQGAAGMHQAVLTWGLALECIRDPKSSSPSPPSSHIDS